jgi:hypothetical protein
LSLTEKLAAPPKQQSKFEAWMETLSDEDSDALYAALNNQAWSTAALIRVIREEGFNVGKDTLQQWRRGTR